MTAPDSATADDMLRRFPFPSVGAGPVRLTRVLAGMGAIGLAVEALGLAAMTTLQLDPAVREVVILRVAWTTRNRYIWGGHRAIAEKVDLRLDARRRSWPSGWPLVVRAVDELLEHGRIDAATRAGLDRILTDGEVLEVVTVVGTYRLLAMVTTESDLVAEPGCADLPRTWPGPAPR